MLIDLTPAEKALKSLSGAIDSALDEEFMGRLTDIQQKTISAGVIQNFEFNHIRDGDFGVKLECYMYFILYYFKSFPFQL